MRHRTRIVVLAAVILILAGTAAYLILTPDALDPFRSTSTIEDSAQIDATVIGFVGNPYPDDFGYLRVPGYLENISDSEVKLATVEITLLDADGNKKETIQHDVVNVVPNSRTTFDINAGVVPRDLTAQIAVVKLEVFE